MKQKLILKFFGGPKASLIQSTREDLTNDPHHAAKQILRALHKAGLKTPIGELRLKLRSFGSNGPFADGVFSDGSESFGYLLYAPRDLGTQEVDQFLFNCLDPLPFYFVFRDGRHDRLFSGAVLPDYPELPGAITITWSDREGVGRLDGDQ